LTTDFFFSDDFAFATGFVLLLDFVLALAMVSPRDRELSPQHALLPVTRVPVRFEPAPPVTTYP
jgi:hypothetical protein